MKILTIDRFYESERGTFGKFYDNEELFANTLELQWKENKSNISCIPIGTYICIRVICPTHGETFKILEVPNRYNILFHKGNSIRDTNGCICIGKILTDSLLYPLSKSTSGFNEFIKRLKGINEFKLNIKKSYE